MRFLTDSDPDDKFDLSAEDSALSTAEAAAVHEQKQVEAKMAHMGWCDRWADREGLTSSMGHCMQLRWS